MKTAKKTNPRLNRLIADLKAASRQSGAGIWRDVAKRLEKPSRNYASVNISKINRHTAPEETILIAGKVLGSGDIDHSVTVAALSFSDQASSKILAAGGKCLKIEDLMATGPKSSTIKILR